MPPSAEKLGADELAEALLESLACETRVRAILPLHASDWQAGALALAVLAVRCILYTVYCARINTVQVA